MAPIKAKSGVSKGPNKRSTKSPSSGSASKSQKKNPSRPATQQKSKPSAKVAKKRKKRVYTEKELGIQKLNAIVPAGVQKPKGKKKGKVFVDDRESMMTILAMVTADKEGQIESKMMKARQLEEIRQAREKESEARVDRKKAELEDVKDSLRRKQKSKVNARSANDTEDALGPIKASSKGTKKKKVSFG